MDKCQNIEISNVIQMKILAKTDWLKTKFDFLTKPDWHNTTVSVEMAQPKDLMENVRF